MGRIGEIMAAWGVCEACQLARTRQHVVIGQGYIDREAVHQGVVLFVIGEAPGSHEDLDGKPWEGPAGKILRENVLVAAGVGAAWLTNCIACRPPANRDPDPDEVKLCAGRVIDLLDHVQPDAILCVGKIAEAAVVSDLYGSLANLPRCTIVHPSALLKRGYPDAATVRILNAQVAKVKRLLSRVGKKKAEKAVAPEPESRTMDGMPVLTRGCDHQGFDAGSWYNAHGQAIAIMQVCGKCGVLVADPPRPRKGSEKQAVLIQASSQA